MDSGLRSIASNQCGAANTWRGLSQKDEDGYGMVASELGTARAHTITKGWVRPRQARDSTVGEAKQWESGSSMAFW